MYRKSGMITVEMSLIMMISLWLTFMIIFLGFYSWDMHRLRALAEYTIEYDSSKLTAEMEIEEKQEYLCRLFERYTAQGLFCVKELEYELYVDGDEIKIIYSGIWKSPFQSWLFINSGFDISGELVYKEKHPADFLRLLQGVMKGLGD